MYAATLSAYIVTFSELCTSRYVWSSIWSCGIPPFSSIFRGLWPSTGLHVTILDCESLSACVINLFSSYIQLQLLLQLFLEGMALGRVQFSWILWLALAMKKVSLIVTLILSPVIAVTFKMLQWYVNPSVSYTEQYY